MRGRVLAIDYGERRVGLAISDPLRIIASGLPTMIVNKDSESLSRIAEIVRTESVAEIVMGLPLSLDGTDTKKAAHVRAFAERLREIAGIPVTLADERFTTASAKRILPEVESKRRRRGKEKLDQMAAIIILQDFLRKSET